MLCPIRTVFLSQPLDKALIIVPADDVVRSRHVLIPSDRNSNSETRATITHSGMIMIEQIAIVTTHKTFPEETVQFVNYHLNLGFANIFLFFDNPCDEALKLLEDYSRVTCIVCDSDYWRKFLPQPPLHLDEKQVINANVGLGLAKETGMDWILHIDSDELVYAEEEISPLLSALSRDIHVALLKPFEAVPEKLGYSHPFKEVSLFKTNPAQENIDRAMTQGCHKAFFNGEYFRGYSIGKSAVRTASDRIRSMGVHLPVSHDNQPLAIETLTQAKLLHYDSIGLNIWKEKWAKRASGETIVRFLRENRRNQLHEFIKLFEKSATDEELASLYESLYFIPDEEKKILTELGMLTRIELNHKLFASPHLSNAD